MILEPLTIEQLTKRQRPSAQRRVLNKLGIPYRVRPDNSLVVLAADLAGARGFEPPTPCTPCSMNNLPQLADRKRHIHLRV